MQSQGNRNVSSFVSMLIVLLVSVSCYGNERPEEQPPVEFTGYNIETSSTAERDLVKVGVWLTDQGKLVNAGVYYARKKNETFQYGFDTAIGYLVPVYRFWPFVEVGVKIGTGTVITNFHAEGYPKFGIAVPLSDRLLIYADYLYSYSTQGRRHDYSAASIGFVWRVE
jgi:hypothetical protein